MMGVESIISLFNTGGITLAFIGFLIWLVKYFMRQSKTWREDLIKTQTMFASIVTEHLNHTQKIMVTQQQTMTNLAHRIEIACKVSKTFHNPATIQNPGEEDELPIK